MDKTEVYDATSVHSDKESVAVDLMAERPEQGSSYLAFFNVVCVVAGKDHPFPSFIISFSGAFV